MESRGDPDEQIVRYIQVLVRKINRTIWQLVSIRIAEDERLYQVRQTDLFSNFSWLDPVFHWLLR